MKTTPFRMVFIIRDFMEWLFVGEVAKLYNLSERAIRKKVRKGCFGKQGEGYRYIAGRGRGGRQLQIAISSLPTDIQARYRGKQEQQAAGIRLSLTGSQREQLDFKQMVILDYQDFKATYPKADKRTAFLRQYNEQYPEKTLTWFAVSFLNVVPQLHST